MHILVVNDDGIDAVGLQILSDAAAEFGVVLTIAPHVECSACSHAITLHAPLRLLERGERRYAVTGTPTDCAYLGLHQVSEAPIDLLLSGINHGPNLGGDVFYSGTVAAAMEGARNGVPSIAFSLATRLHSDASWRSAKRVVTEVLAWFLAQPPLSVGRLLNVNIPPAPLSTPAPLRVTRLGEVQYPPRVDARDDPKGGRYYWIGGSRPNYGTDPDTDCGAIQQGFVSLTPLRLELTDFPQISTLGSLLPAP